MADQADVERVLVSLISLAIYPNGTSSSSVPGPDCRIYRGWPNPAALDADLSSGRINVTVFPIEGEARVTTRYSEEWIGTPAASSLSVVTQDSTVTFVGTAEPGQVAGIAADGRCYVRRTASGDTLALLAADLASQARADFIVTLDGTSLTIHGASNVIARVVPDVPSIKEIRRQEQAFRVTCWCPSPDSRDAAASAIDGSLAGLTFISMPDSSFARLAYDRTAVFDQAQDALLYRRDLIYKVEYSTTLAEQLPTMLFGIVTSNSAIAIA